MSETEQDEDYDDALRETALAALVKAGAATRCPYHTEILLRVGDDEQVRNAQALAPHLAPDKAGLDRTDLLVRLREILDGAVESCPHCGTA